MKALKFALLHLVREWRSGEFVVLVLALIVAVTALTAVGFFTSRVERAISQQAGEVLAADLRLQSSTPIPAQYFARAHESGLQSAEVQWFPSVILFGEQSSLAAIRGVSAAYPLRGKLKVSSAPFAPSTEITRSPSRGEAWADPRLLARLGAHVGDRLKLGRLELPVTRVLDYRPDQGTQFVDLAPTLLINVEDVAATGLVQPGSRVNYAALFAGSPQAVASFKSELSGSKRPGERLIDVSDASPQIRSSIDRAGRFLNLAGLVTVILAAIAVAMAARRYATRHLDTVALMKSIGASQSLVLQITLSELLLLGLAASVIGSVLGYLGQEILTFMLRDLISGSLPSASLTPALLGLVTPPIVLSGFALPPLLQLKRVPPARVLRHNVEPPPLRYTTIYGMASAAIVLLLVALVRDLKLVTYVSLGAIGTIVVLYAAGWLLVRGLSRWRGAVGVSWRYGMANVSRRGRESVVQIVAFGLGLMVLLLLAVVHNDLLREWRASLPPDAPNQFIINIRPDQSAELQQFFSQHGIKTPRLVPMVRARIARINNVPVQNMPAQNDRAREFMEREANLTWAEDMQEGNKLVAGQWWHAGDRGGPRVSVEKDIAEALGLKLGDLITYDVAGELISAKVTSFREVHWDSFKPNFFMVFSPGVIDAALGTYITAVRLEAAQRPVLTEFFRKFPEVTVIDIDAVLVQVRGVMDKAAAAVQYVFLFAVFAGVTVLLAAIQSTRDERRYESAMLRTLGASRRVVLQGVAAEFIVLGLLAGTLAATGASAAGYYVATHLLDLKYTLDLTVWAVGLLLGAGLVGITGTLATRSVVNHPPAATLKSAGT